MTLPLPHSYVSPVEVRENFEFIAEQFPVQMPCARAYKTGSQTLATATNTAVTFDAEEFDTGSIWSSSASTKFYAPTAGYYRFSYVCWWNSSAAGLRRSWVYKNGSGTDYGWDQRPPVGAGDGAVTNGSDIVQMAAGDYLELYGMQNSGGNLALLNTETSFAMEKVSP